jgi:hypothetical protein
MILKVHLKTLCLSDEGVQNLQTTEELQKINMNIFDENVKKKCQK